MKVNALLAFFLHGALLMKGNPLQDIDESGSAEDNNCHANATFTNNNGSFTCACSTGYSGNGTTCVDIDECATATKNCHANATCVNIDGSFTCACSSGYSGDGKSCDDINECTLETDNCNQNADCTNNPGSYSCTCNNGYTGDGMTCTDIDECNTATNNCRANSTCTNNVGSFTCACSSGYSGDGISCDDIDECTTNNGGCHNNAGCNNSQGSFSCTCNNGYIGDGTTCTDIDECATTPNNCDTNANCANTAGSYSCSCKEGFDGDGSSCADQCTSNPCKNSGTCYSRTAPPYYSCACKPQYQGLQCQDRKYITIGNCKYHIKSGRNRTDRTYFADANSTCLNLGGSLAMIKSLEIQDLLENQTIAQYGSDGSIELWIGGYKSNNVWLWMDGTHIHQTGDNKKWAKPKNDYMILSSRKTTRDKMRWLGKPKNKYTKGYICEVEVADPCDSMICRNGGTCISTGCQRNCICAPGFIGDRCQTELITISLSTQSIALYKGQSLTVSLTVKSYDGSVEVSYRKGSESPTDKQITISNAGLSATTEFSLGIQLESVMYYFDVHPQSVPHTYSRADTISITVIDLCESPPCMGRGTCNYDTSEPYYACTCEPEYDGQTCQDCRVGTCLNGGSCAIVDGRYNCYCQAGYFGDKCEKDIDECSNSDTNNCSASATCTNNKGSFSCACNFGYIGNGVICVDIDECGTKTDSCDTNADCANTVGSHTCTCKDGFTGDGTTCTDIDECATNHRDCDTNANCTNSPGSYSCTCKSGYTGSGTTCTDIDECAIATNNNCHANATCTDNDGSYTCACNSGYYGDGSSCVDIDECASATDNNCHDSATCSNNVGSFTCACNSGYSGDGITCVDINECVTANICHASATCSNNNGSFTCACNTGYTGDGIITCNDGITISPAKDSYTTRALGIVNVNLSIASDDGVVKLEVFKESETDTILQTKRNVSTTIQLSIGPLPNPTAGTTYVFRATPESAPGSYFKNASVNIIVTDQCTPMLCENSGVCNYETTSPYYSCACIPEYQGQQCEDRKFITNGNCKYHVNSENSLNFTTANSTCSNLQGSLAMIKSLDIQDLLENQTIFQYGSNGSSEFWIGGYKSNNSWIWMDGTKIPQTESNQKWVNTTNDYMMISSLESTRDNMRSFSKANNDFIKGYICEVAVTNPCTAVECMNGGTCVATGCQNNCECSPGFNGGLCQADRITITPEENEYTVAQGQSVAVKLNITSNHGAVQIIVSNAGNKVDFVRNDDVYVTITIGPLNAQTNGDKYTFQATPQTALGAYNRTAYVNIRVEGPPTVKISKQNLALPVNQICKSIRCEALSVPKSLITWKQHGVEITTVESAAVRQYESGGNQYLEFKNSSRNEVGYYTCFVENTVVGKKTMRNATLFVRGKLRLLNKSEHHTKSAIRSSTFSCAYEGYPAPKIEWKWGNGDNMTKIKLDKTGSIFEIQNVAENTSVLNPTTSTLTIKLPELLGRVHVSCCASNDYEDHKSTFQLNEDLFLLENVSYRIYNGTLRRNFSNAKEICHSHDRTLLRIPNNITQTMLSKMLQNRKINDNVYIGARRRDQKNIIIWQWNNGEFLYNETKNGGWKEGDQLVDGSYIAWDNGEPNDPDNDCAVLDSSKQGAWSDAKCSGQQGFICESLVAGIPRDFMIDVKKCSANISVTWTAATEAIGIKHSIEVLGSNSTTRVPTNGSSNVQQFNNLKPDTTYNVTIRVCPDCSHSYNITKPISTYAIVPAFNLTVTSANFTRVNKTCVLEWSISSKGIMGFQVVVSSVLACRASLKHSTPNDTKIYNTSREKHEHDILTTPNRIYHFTIAIKTCTGLGPPFTAHGDCISKREAPYSIPASTVVPELNDDGTMGIQIRMPDESNGTLSCIFFIVVYKPEASGNKSIKYELENIKNAMSKSTVESLNANDAYIALAITRSNAISEIDGNEYFTRNLGDNSGSECDVAADMTSKRRKRSTSDYNIKAKNRKLEDEASYNFFTVTSTPSDEEVFFQTSEASFFSTPARRISVVILIGAIVPIVLVACLIPGVLVYLKKRQNFKTESPENLNMQEMNENSENPYANLAMGNNHPRTETDIQSEQLQATYNSLKEKENAGFQEQFQKLKQEAQKLDYPTEMASNPAMKKKNRYKNILPCDNTRVILTGGWESSYVNACYVHGFSRPRKFIASQGPLPATVNDFWRMIVEQKCSVIVMLTRCRENYKVKCEKYWPDLESSKMFGDVTVENCHEQTYGCYRVRNLKVTHGGQMRAVKQLHYLDWPDHGVPVTTSNLLRYHETVSQYRTDAPVVVHCSAGVGRTGTLIAYDILSEEAESLSYVDVYSCVMKMREQRVDMVQSCDQYILIHKLLLEKYLFGRTEISTDEVSDVLSSEIIVRKEFENLSIVGPINQTKFGDLPKNRPFNRSKDVIPYERNHITIIMRDADTEVPYINASTIETYDPTTNIIVTQGPVKASVEHFWRAILDSNINTIVMLTKCLEGKKEQSARYWPDEKEKNLTMKGMTVFVRNRSASEQLIVRKFQVSRDNKEKTIVQYQYVGWNSKESPENATDILEVIEKMHSSARLTEGAKILVHCSDGAGRTGSFCAIVNILDRLKIESKVDVFRTVKDLRDCRPGMVQTMEQYRFIYEAVSAYLTSLSIHSNFEAEEQEQSENIYQSL